MGCAQMVQPDQSSQKAIPSLQELIALVDMPINLSLLAHSDPVLTRESFTRHSSPNLRDVLVPWYKCDDVPVIHQTGFDRQLFPTVKDRWPTRGDRPLTLGEVALSARPAHPWFKPNSIRPNPSSTGWYPAYNVGGGRRLLLDGNHRCISLIRSNLDYDIALIVINGPIRREILPTLVCSRTKPNVDE
jgi:hypothetical protein